MKTLVYFLIGILLELPCLNQKPHRGFASMRCFNSMHFTCMASSDRPCFWHHHYLHPKAIQCAVFFRWCGNSHSRKRTRMETLFVWRACLWHGMGYFRSLSWTNVYCFEGRFSSYTRGDFRRNAWYFFLRCFSKTSSSLDWFWNPRANTSPS